MGLMKELAIEMEDFGLAAARSAAQARGLDPDVAEDLLMGLMEGDSGAYRMAVRATESDDATACEANMRNPLGLVGSDLVAVGWETRDGVTWEHDKHGEGHTFYTATAVEASGQGLCCNPLDTPANF